MKNRFDVLVRLNKLVKRYKRTFVEDNTRRIPNNCCHNAKHDPPGMRSTKSFDVSLSPRRQSTLIVVYPEVPSRICMFGSNDPSSWNGTICDSEEVSSGCEFFKPTHSIVKLESDFEKLMEDDDHVLTYYPDVASLQWVLQTRWYSSFFRYFRLPTWKKITQIKWKIW